MEREGLGHLRPAGGEQRPHGHRVHLLSSFPAAGDPVSPTGLDALIGLEFLEVAPDRVVARLAVDDRHLQPMGIVHGGIHAAVAETVASYGAVLAARTRDPTSMAVGLENHTTFLRAARAGAVLRFEATPLHAGRHTQSWEVRITDEASGRAVARSSVRLLVVAPGQV